MTCLINEGFRSRFFKLGQESWRVTQKVLSYSKHTLLCLYGHNVLGRINLIPLKTLRWFAQVAGGAKPPRNDSFFAMSKG